MRGRRCDNEIVPKFAVDEKCLHKTVAIDDDQLQVRKKIVDCQLKSKAYHDKVHRAVHKEFSKGDWALVKKPNTQLKGESKYFDPEEIIEVSESAIHLKKLGWRNKSDAIKLKQGQVELWYKEKHDNASQVNKYSWLNTYCGDNSAEDSDRSECVSDAMTNYSVVKGGRVSVRDTLSGTEEVINDTEEVLEDSSSHAPNQEFPRPSVSRRVELEYQGGWDGTCTRYSRISKLPKALKDFALF